MPGHPEKSGVKWVKSIENPTFLAYFPPNFSGWPGTLFLTCFNYFGFSALQHETGNTNLRCFLMVPSRGFLFPRFCGGSLREPKVHARYDWTTGVPDDGNVWRKYRVVPRAYPSHPLIFVLTFIGFRKQRTL